MSKEDTVSAQKQAIIDGESAVIEQALGAAFDAGFSEGAASVPPPDADEQAKIDAAVLAAVTPLQAQIDQDAKDLADAHAKADADLAAVNQSLADMTAKEQMEEQAVADVKAKIDSVQASFDAIRALFSPQP
jgi:hypothetical protein